MNTTWIVAADSGRARIFEKRGTQEHLHEIEDFANPAGRMGMGEPDGETVKRLLEKGDLAAGPESEHPYSAGQELELYVQRVSAFLDQAHLDRRYDRLCLLGCPRVLGRLHYALSREIQPLVEDEVPSDFPSLELHDIEEYVRRLH